VAVITFAVTVMSPTFVPLMNAQKITFVKIILLFYYDFSWQPGFYQKHWRCRSSHCLRRTDCFPL